VKRFLAIMIVAFAMIGTVAGCAMQQAEEDEHLKPVAQWIGKDRVQLANAMGQPIEAYPLRETGGEMLFYSHGGHHYVFETGPDGLIDSAVQTK